MGDGATDLADLLNGAGSSNGPLPQSTTFAPITTGGGNPFIAPQPSASAQYTQPSSGGGGGYGFSTLRYAVKNLITYFGFFLAAAIISLSTPRSLLLQYIPNTYTSGGIVSYTGAAVLAGVAVAISYVVGTLGNALV
jgi:hypothetical protein